MPSKKTNHVFDKKRRQLLKFLGIGSAVTIGQSAASQIIVRKQPNPIRQVEVGGNGVNYISVKLLRPYDLLSLELRYYNFNLSDNTLQKKGSPAYLVVVFQPQSMSEQAWPDDNNGLSTPTIPGRMIIGGESRLVFQVPASISTIPLITSELLAWEKYDLVVNERAKGFGNTRRLSGAILNQKLNDFQKIANSKNNNKISIIKKGLSKDEKLIITDLKVTENPGLIRNIANINQSVIQLTKDAVSPPGELETSLEVPVRLYLSPTKDAAWKHETKLKDVKGFIKETNKLFELWHTRMCIKKYGKVVENDITNEERLLRALWADDANKNYTEDVIEKKSDNQILLTSITNKDRHQIVHESSNFTILGFSPQPVKAYKLFLTTLGAWLDSEFVVEKENLIKGKIFLGTSGNNGFNLLKWRHIETMGREHYVEIVKAGYIMPFGHSAVLIKITERKAHTRTGTAANFQKELVVITESVKDYNYRDSKGKFMEFSFASVEMITTVSPLLDASKKALWPVSNPSPDQQFIITSGGKDVMFKIRGKDLNDNIVDFSMPLVFINSEVLGSAANLSGLIDQYNGQILNPIRETKFNGQKFTLAPPEKNGGDTAFATHDVTFGVIPYSSVDELQGFLPKIAVAKIIEPSYQRLTGISQPIPVKLEDDNNNGSVFASFDIPSPVNFAGNADKVGGLATPNFNLTGLSKAAGAFGGALNQFKSGAPAASSFFNVKNLPEPTLFGVFKLSEILQFASGGSFDLSKNISDRLNNSGIPNLVTQDTTDAFITSYAVKPTTVSKSIGSFVRFNASPAAGDGLIINTTVKAWKDSTKAPEFKSSSSLKNFSVDIVLLGADALVKVKFDHIKFDVSGSKKPDVSVKMKDKDGISFGGPLSFVNALNSLIPMNGFDDPPYLDVSLTGVKCGYTQALPNLQLGAFTLANISLAAEVNLPFTGGPLTMGFRFCERQQPFTLTVSCLGGGGFFGMEVDLHGIRQIEAALEFGAAASVNFGVASGAVSIMAGIYFKMTFESGQNSTQLTGYVRINGAVSVLGLITASIELYMALTYLIDKNKAYGEASLKIKVEVLFFSKTVTLHTQKTFAGSGKDPNFATAISYDNWKEYCEAFAA